MQPKARSLKGRCIRRSLSVYIGDRLRELATHVHPGSVASRLTSSSLGGFANGIKAAASRWISHSGLLLKFSRQPGDRRRADQAPALALQLGRARHRDRRAPAATRPTQRRHPGLPRLARRPVRAALHPPSSSWRMARLPAGQCSSLVSMSSFPCIRRSLERSRQSRAAPRTEGPRSPTTPGGRARAR